MLLWALGHVYHFKLQFRLDTCPGFGIAGSHNKTIFRFFLRSLHTLFLGGCTHLHFCQHSGSIPFSPHPFQHLLFADFLIMAIVACVRYNFVKALICIYLIIGHAEHLFICLLTTCMFSLKKCLFRSSAQFLVGLFVFCRWVTLKAITLNPLAKSRLRSVTNNVEWPEKENGRSFILEKDFSPSEKIRKPALTEFLPCLCQVPVGPVTCINSFNFHHNPMRWVILSPLYRWWNWGTESLT